MKINRPLIKINRTSWTNMLPKRKGEPNPSGREFVYPIFKSTEPELLEAAFPNTKLIHVQCYKNSPKMFLGEGKGSGGGQTISMEMCLHSVFRFSPKSRECRSCLGAKTKTEIPKLFLEAEKVTYITKQLHTLKFEKEEEKKDDPNTSCEG